MTRHLLVLAIAASALQPPVFRSVAEVVLLPVSVTNNGRPVSNLTAEDFEVMDNGVRQVVEASSLQALPIDVTLLADVSGSVDGTTWARFTDELQDIARALPAEDRVRLLTFGASVRDETGWQRGGAPLSLDQLAPGGGTSFYDGLAAALLAARSTDRPHVIVAFSDGLDTTSVLDLSTLGTVAARTPATLYVSLVRAPERSLRGVAPWSGQPDVRLLRSAAAVTGGALFEHRSRTDLSLAFQQALDTFRTMYLLRFAPSAAPGWHTLTVRVPGTRYTVRAREGYERPGPARR
jgi:VWFA-related protein